MSAGQKNLDVNKYLRKSNLSLYEVTDIIVKYSQIWAKRNPQYSNYSWKR